MTEQKQPRSPFDRANTEIAEGLPDDFVARALTPRKRRMIDGYVRTGTYVGAAEASGYSQATCKKYIENDKAVRKAIGEMVDQAALISGVTLERVLQEYARLAFSDVGEIADLLKFDDDPDAALELLADLPADITAAISEISFSRKHETTNDDKEFVTGAFKVKFYDKKSALTDLGRMLSLFNDKLTIEDKSGFGDRLERALQKLEAATDGETDT